MSTRPPAFQFYPKDWMDVNVRRLTLAGKGAYIDLLAFMWKDSDDQCTIPYDVEAIAKALGVDGSEAEAVIAEIMRPGFACFSVKKKRGVSYLFSSRLHKEHVQQSDYRKKQQAKGRKSAEARRQPRLNHGATTAQPEGNSSSSSSKDLRDDRKENNLPGGTPLRAGAVSDGSQAVDISTLEVLKRSMMRAYPDLNESTVALDLSRHVGVIGEERLTGLVEAIIERGDIKRPLRYLSTSVTRAFTSGGAS